MFDKELELYIYLTVGESCLRIYDSKSKVVKFESYQTWCQYLSNVLKRKATNKDFFLHDLSKIHDDLHNLYALSMEESIYYVYKFFIEGYWSSIYHLTKERQEYFGKTLF